MKTVYIPQGESRTYENLVTDLVVVHGYLHITHNLKAKKIIGKGAIDAGDVSADIVSIDDLECARVTCRKLMSKSVNSAEVFASDSAAVSCFLGSAYVRTGKLTTTVSEIDVVDAQEIVNLRHHKYGMLFTLLASTLHSFWARMTGYDWSGEAMDAEFEVIREQDNNDPMPVTREEIAKTVREIMAQENEDDFELKRIIAQFKLLRERGYTLKIIPGTPEENAPKFGAATADILPFDEAISHGKAA